MDSVLIDPLALLGCHHDRVRRGAGVKAVVYDRYGLPDVLHVEDVPVPSPAAGQVRVRVAATSVNLSDWECLRGSPAYARVGGLRFPARRTLGSDIAGVVDDVGAGVTRFRPGDEVYGDNLALKGGFAEYAIVPESALAHKPNQLTFAEASTIPQAGAIALQGTERAVAGSRVLINGAGGGSGSFAIQLAKRLGAHVTGVDNAAKQDFMRSVGADDVIDYSREDFTRDDAAVRPDPGPGRAPVGVRLPARAGTRRHVSVRRRVGARVAARAHRRLGGRATYRSLDRGARREGGAGPLRAGCRPLCYRRSKDPHRPHVRPRRGSRRSCSRR